MCTMCSAVNIVLFCVLQYLISGLLNWSSSKKCRDSVLCESAVGSCLKYTVQRFSYKSEAFQFLHALTQMPHDRSTENVQWLQTASLDGQELFSCCFSEQQQNNRLMLLGSDLTRSERGLLCNKCHCANYSQYTFLSSLFLFFPRF